MVELRQHDDYISGNARVPIRRVDVTVFLTRYFDREISCVELKVGIGCVSIHTRILIKLFKLQLNLVALELFSSEVRLNCVYTSVL